MKGTTYLTVLYCAIQVGDFIKKVLKPIPNPNYHIMSTVNLIFGVSGIYLCFLSWGVLQERVSTSNYYSYDDLTKEHPKKYYFFVFLNWIQAICALLCSYIYVRILGHHSISDATGDLYTMFGKVAFLRSSASPFGYEALKYIDYPTIILGKSCKIIPVMIMAFVLHGHVFEFFKYISAGLITLGVSLFMLLQPGNVSSQFSSSFYGLFLLTINLLIDGAFNSSQDEIFKKYRISGMSFLSSYPGPQMMYFMNLFSVFFMLIYMVCFSPFLRGSSEFFEALHFVSNHDVIFWDLLLLGFCGAAGEIFIFYTLEKFGSVFLVTINVTRKMFSMLLSVFLFNHALSSGQWLGVGLVFTGIGIEAFMSKKPKSKKPLKDENVRIEKNKSE